MYALHLKRQVFLDSYITGLTFDFHISLYIQKSVNAMKVALTINSNYLLNSLLFNGGIKQTTII